MRQDQRSLPRERKAETTDLSLPSGERLIRGALHWSTSDNREVRDKECMPEKRDRTYRVLQIECPRPPRRPSLAPNRDRAQVLLPIATAPKSCLLPRPHPSLAARCCRRRLQTRNKTPSQRTHTKQNAPTPRPCTSMSATQNAHARKRTTFHAITRRMGQIPSPRQ